jgi:hypothetical protein
MSGYAASVFAVLSLFTLSPTPSVQECYVSDWGQWGTCSDQCVLGTSQRSRAGAATVPAPDESSCPPLSESSNCTSLQCVDCATGSWSPWQSCSAECGGGVRSRLRGAIVVPQGVAQDCPAFAEDDACNVQVCTWPPTSIQPRTCPACEEAYYLCSVALRRAGTNGSMLDVYQLVCVAGGVCEALLACVKSYACSQVDELLDPAAVRTVCHHCIWAYSPHSEWTADVGTPSASFGVHACPCQRAP